MHGPRRRSRPGLADRRMGEGLNRLGRRGTPRQPARSNHRAHRGGTGVDRSRRRGRARGRRDHHRSHRRRIRAGVGCGRNQVDLVVASPPRTSRSRQHRDHVCSPGGRHVDPGLVPGGRTGRQCEHTTAVAHVRRRQVGRHGMDRRCEVAETNPAADRPDTGTWVTGVSVTSRAITSVVGDAQSSATARLPML